MSITTRGWGTRGLIVSWGWGSVFRGAILPKWSEAIELLIERIAGTDPERDPQARFYPIPKIDSSRIDRNFMIEPPASLEFGPTNTGDAVHGKAVISVQYRHRTEAMELLKDMGDDAEWLLQWVSYFPGQEWAKPQGYDFWIGDPAQMEQDTEGGILMIPVQFQYNMRD